MNIVKSVKIVRPLGLWQWIFIIIGLILVLDQLYLFGIPFGPFLPNLAHLDPTNSEIVHHWMLGLGMIVFALFFTFPRRRK
jgi:hypothetical protein